MNQYEKRIQALERRRNECQITPVVIVGLTEAGEYLYRGIPYSGEAFGGLMEKIRPDAVIIDNIPKQKAETARTAAYEG